MGAAESKQKAVLNQIAHSIRQAKELLKKHHLFVIDNALEIRGASIVPSSDVQFKMGHSLLDFYSNNSPCFAIKLIDESIFTLYALTNGKGDLVRFSYAFCSCPYLLDLLNEKEDFQLNNKLRAFGSAGTMGGFGKTEGNAKETMFEALLFDYFRDPCKEDETLIKSIIDLARNPIYLRCDFDSENISEFHPEFHLSLNFLSESRFRVDEEFTFFDFVTFILDAVYGKKELETRQFIHLAQ